MTAAMLSRICAILVLLSAAASDRATPFSGSSKTSPRAESYRLPTDVIPQNYRLVILPEYPDEGLAESEVYKGEEVISAKVQGTGNIKQITFHKASTITQIDVICVIKVEEEASMPDDDLPQLSSFCNDNMGTLLLKGGEEEDEVTEKFTIHLEEELNPNDNIWIVLSFIAKYPEGGLTGFYVSTYKEADETVGMLTTKFEPTHARKAFPCFDEPALKATFDLTVKRKEGLDVISNMDVKKRFETTSGIPYITFKTSPKMSTYLLVFIVFEEKHFVNTDEILRPLENSVPFRTWGRKYMIEEVKGGRLSQIEGPAALDFLERYTGILYNEMMSKMEMAAIPDFQSGAMENWALVTYRETALIYNEATGTTTNYKRVVDVIAHELVHMWFGNLVTCDWWSSIWLNEGFATYLQYLVVHERYPNWRMLERFVLDEQMTVYGTDSDADVAPLTDESVLSPEQIGNHFSSISYNKGGAILRQLRNIMGEENFNQGVQDYLQERKLNFATPDHLLNNLVKYNAQTTTGLSSTEFREVFNDWTKKRGFPVITIERNGNEFNISQERYLLTGTESTPTTYPVYLTYTSPGDGPATTPKQPHAWLLSSDPWKLVTIEDIASSDWVLWNAFQGGYYRVNYDASEWQRIGRALDAEGALALVAPLDRAALVDNALALARSQHISYATALRALRFLRHDTAYEPWAAARTGLAHLQRMQGHEQSFKDFIAYIIEEVYEEVGFDTKRGDAHIDKVHRANVLNLACSAGYEHCLKESRKRLQQYLSYNSIAVEPDVQSVVYCYGLQNDTGTQWQQLWNEYADADSAVRATLTSALGCINHRDTLKNFLEKSLSDEVRSQDAYTVFSSVYSNPFGVTVALDFLTFWGYEKLEEKYGAVRNAMVTLVSGLAARLTSEDQKEQLSIAVAGYASRHGSAIRTAESNLKWLEDFGPEVSAALAGSVTYSFPGAAPSAALATSLALLCAALLALLR